MKMKTNFKYVMLMAVALVMGFSSCGNEEETAGNTDEGTPKSVTVSISAPSTYANEEPTAVGKTPVIYDANVYFIGGGIIKAQGTMTTAEIESAKTFTNVPGSATKVVIIANATKLSSPDVSTIADNDPESKLNALMFEQSVQINPESAVNAYGYANITGTPGSETAAVTLAPAISRIEIAEVKVKDGAGIKLTEFKLAGIYINNTYTECGTDYSTLPTAPADILNYAGTNAIWTDGSYPARFCDEWASPSSATSFKPATSTNKWSYYVMPVVAGKGTIINSEQQTSIPNIVLKITDAQATGYGFASTMYVTIRDIQVGGSSLTQLERGKVYSISEIAIGGENLAATPETPATQSVSVTATVTQWTDQPVTPVIP